MSTNNSKAKMIKSIYALTPMQEGMLYHNIENKKSTGYMIQTIFNLEGLLDEQKLEEALEIISDRYDVLRTFILHEKVSKPLQIVLKKRKIELQKTYLETCSKEEQVSKIEKIKEKDLQRGFDLQKDTLLRVNYIDLGNNNHKMIWSHHHIIMDGWCTSIIYGDFMRYYNMLVRGNTFEDVKEISETERLNTAEYGDYVKWLEEQDLDKALEYFKELLGEYEEDAKIEPMMIAKENDSQCEEESIILDNNIVNKLNNTANNVGVTLNTIFETAWGVLLQKYNFISKAVFGKVVSGRNAEITGIDNMMGLFINTIPIIVDSYDKTDIQSLLRNVQEQAIESGKYDYCPLTRIQALTMQKSELIKTLFAFENYYINEEKLEGAEDELKIQLEKTREQTNYDISVTVVAQDDCIKVNILYNPNKYVSNEIKLILEKLQIVLEYFASDITLKIADIELITKSEKDKILYEFNNTYLQYEKNISLVDIFEKIVCDNGENIAVAINDESITYSELNNKANIIARKLKNMGVQNNDFVGIIAQKSIEMFIGIIGILKAGAGYVPIDPTYPKGRIEFILKDCSSKAVLIYNANIETNISVIDLKDKNIYTGEQSNLNINIHNDNIAYCIYTSGTTGNPKGVILTHKGVVAMRAYFLHEYNVDVKDNVLQFANYVFDASVWEITMSLFTGARLTVVTQDIISDVKLFNEYVKKTGINITLLPPQYYLETDIKNLKLLVTGGSASNLEIVNKAKENEKYVNAYGPTEGTVLVTRWEYDSACKIRKSIPIGKPIPNAKVYVMNKMHMCGIGEIGELCMSGDGLAKGYLNNEKLNNEKFVKNPFTNEKMYRTGDLARWTFDGNIEFLGRIDQQVKIRGFRIEIAEVENAIRKQDSVKDVAVIVKEKENNDKVLCAYVIADEKKEFLEFQEKLSEDLPRYMIPSYVIYVESLPLTRNGKLDREALPEIDFNRANDYEAPKTEIEIMLCEIFEEILGVKKVGINDSFYELGGDSIKAIRAVSKIREKGYSILITDIIKKQVVKLIAVSILKNNENKQTYKQDEVTGNVKKTPIIKEFFNWNLKKKEHFNQSIMIDVSNYTKEDVKKVLNSIVLRHDMLRMVVKNNELEILSYKDSKLFELKLFDFSEKDNEKQLIENECNNIQKSFELEKGPLVKSAIFVTKEDKKMLMLCIHHLVVDGISFRIILEDIKTAFSQISEGKDISLPKKTASFKEWSQALIDYKESERFKEEKEYWKRIKTKSEKISSIEKDNSEFDNENMGLINVEFSEEETNNLLTKTNQAFNTNINDILLCSLAKAFNTSFETKDIIIGLESHGREELDKEIDIYRTVGWFTNIYPVILSSSKSIEKCIIENKENLHKVPSNGIGYGLIKDEIGEMDIQIYFNYLGEIVTNNNNISKEETYSTGENSALENGIMGSILINGVINNKKLSFSIVYKKNRYDEESINILGIAFRKHLLSTVEYCIKCDKKLKTASDFYVKNLEYEDIQEILKDYENKKYYVEDIYSLNPLQEGMFFHSIAKKDTTDYIVQNIFSVQGTFEKGIVEKALDLLSQKYDVFKTVVSYKNIARPVQVVLENKGIDFELVDITNYSDKENAINEIKQTEINKGFDLQYDSLLRVKYIKVESKKIEMIWTYHHIIMDGWCLSLVFGDFLEFYEKIKLGVELEQIKNQIQKNKKKKASYKDYIKWLENQDKTKALDYFETLLKDYDEIAEFKPSNNKIKTDLQMSKKGMNLSKKYSEKLIKLAKEHNMTINTILETAYGMVLQNYNYSNDVVFGKVVSGRGADIAGIEDIVGLFINTIPVRIRKEQDNTIKELLESVKKQDEESTLYDYCSLSNVQEKTQMRSDLVKTIFVFENYYINKERLNESDNDFTIDVKEAREQTNYDISFCTKNIDEMIHFEIMYNPQKYTINYIERILNMYEKILMEIVDGIDKKISQIDIISKEDQKYIIDDFNDKQDFDYNKTFVEVFQEQVSRYPDNKCVVYNNEYFTYKEINEKANSLANLLRNSGVKREDYVVVISQKNIQTIIAILGIIKAGAVYVPVDEQLPIERKNYIINDCIPKIILKSSYKEAFKIPTIDLNNKAVYENNKENLQIINNYSDALYVIYTSGTTGKPKGVIIENKGVVNLKNYFYNDIRVSDEDVVLQFANFCFDASIWEITMAFLNGACLVIPTNNQIQNMEEFEKLIIKEKVTVATLPPVYYAKVEEFDIKILITAGSESNKEIVQKTKNRYLNAYGPTESTVCATHWEYKRGDDIPKNIPIGKPIRNVMVHILNGMKLCPIDVPGELCILGAGLARGYLNKEELTKEKFVDSPYLDGKMYRSGDLAKWTEDGNIEFLGRIDDQVKIRGYRIELLEIESAIRENSDILDAVVVIDKDLSGEKCICMYIVSDKKLDMHDVREYLSNKVPAYMIPDYIAQIDSIPVTHNGKVDKKALPKIIVKTNNVYVEPKNYIEEKLVNIISKLTGVEKISTIDDIFEYGINSIKAIGIVTKLRKMGMELNIQNIFEGRTIKKISDSISVKVKRNIEKDKKAADENEYLKILNLNKIDESIKIRKNSFKNIFLTGVTGFLGIHLLLELMDNSRSNIYCMIRCKDEEDGYMRLRDTLKYYCQKNYMEYEKYFRKRIFVISGTIEEICNISFNIDAIIHSAAITKHYGFKDEFININVNGTKKLLELAREKHAKFVYISTTSVKGMIDKDSDVKVFDETCCDVGQIIGLSEYSKSKFIAEKLVLDAKILGNDVTIIRVGNLTNRYTDGIGIKNYYENRFLNIIKFILDKGYIINEIDDMMLQFTPVDLAAQAICCILKKDCEEHSIYHIYNDKEINFKKMRKGFEACGINLICKNEDFDTYIKDKANVYVQMSVMEEEVNENADMLKANCDFTKWFLNKVGFAWKEIDEEYLYKMIKNLIDAGFWKRG